MTDLSPPPQTVAADENTPPSARDPHWPSTPRTAQGEFSKAALYQQLSSHPPKRPLIRSTNQQRGPQCTHTTMTRLYGPYVCHMCGQLPSLRFVYLCEQDHLDEIRGKCSSIESLPLVSDHGNFFNAQAEIAKSLGMSNSVIRQMRAGEYSYEQIECLLAQRHNVKEVIKHTKHEHASSAPAPLARPMKKLAKLTPSENIIAQAGLGIAAPVTQQASEENLPMSLAGTPSNTPTTSPTTTPTKKPKRIKCNFQVCHTCRPFFQDRAFNSLGALLNDELPAVTDAEIANLPVCNAVIVRRLGLREAPQLASVLHDHGLYLLHEDDGEDDTSEECSPTSSAKSEDASDASTEAILFPSPEVGEGQMQGCVYGNGFDDAQRATIHGYAVNEDAEQVTTFTQAPALDRHHHIRGTPLNSPFASSSSSSSGASSISLPEATNEPSTPITPRFASSDALFTGKTRIHHGPVFGGGRVWRSKTTPHFSVRGKDSSSSLGSEVDVDGGVALMEEAVETGAPDIVTDEEQ